ncbi:hypothetical protein BB559_003229 [Furculomyces boomerangus]|uniref:RRM domain-containing protein n=1 Tax=Furculomyces boomerangus TaxID=61424 RepID=A0A2T9YMR7_9FUNG|nr:hypothetical protein BB559_003229 [Furculomyces boomerangus]
MELKTLEVDQTQKPTSETNAKNLNEEITVRVYVGGLPDNTTSKELEAKFKPFGEIDNVNMPKNHPGTKPRGIGYLTLKSTLHKWSKCQNLYNGAKWKGSLLKVAVAKEHYLDRINREIEKNKTTEIKSIKPKKAFYKSSVLMSEDMSLVTEKNVDGRKGWKRGRYGRAVAVLRMRDPKGKIISIDPLKYRNNLEKLFGTIKPKRLADLDYYYDKDNQDFDFLSDSENEKEQKNDTNFKHRSSLYSKNSRDTQNEMDVDSTDTFSKKNLPNNDYTEIGDINLQDYGNIDQLIKDNKVNLELERKRNLDLINFIVSDDDNISHENSKKIKTEVSTPFTEESDDDIDIEELYNRFGTSTRDGTTNRSKGPNYQKEIGTKNNGEFEQNHKENEDEPEKTIDSNQTASFKSLFSGGGVSSKLFGGDESDNEHKTEIHQLFENNNLKADYHTKKFDQMADDQEVETKPLFFTHIGEPELYEKSLFHFVSSYNTELQNNNNNIGEDQEIEHEIDDFKFFNTKTKEEMHENWDKQRLFLNRDYKSKYRNAKSKSAKSSKKVFYGKSGKQRGNA